MAANTLGKLGLPSFAENDPVIVGLRAELKTVRHQHFLARTHRQKMKLRGQDRDIRARLSHEIQSILKAKNDDAELLASFDPYNQNTSAQFFDPEWMFNQAKFDVVIGNPPYVRQERIKDDKPWLKQNYANYFDGKADLFVYFFARGMELLKPGGVLTYICSNKFFRSGYGKNLRTQLAKKTITRIIDFGDAPVFEAIAYPSIIAVQEAKPAANYVIDALNWDPEWQIDDYRQVMREQGFDLAQSSLKLDGWQVEEQGKLRLLEHLKSVGQPLDKYVDGRFYYGIKTGLNEAFVVDRTTRDALIAEDPRSEEVLKPYLRGRDVKRWVIEDPDLWLIFTRKGIKIDNYKAIKKHLQCYRKELTPGGPGGRKSGNYKWYEIQDNIAYHESFLGKKIIVPAIVSGPQYSIDYNGFYTNDKTSIISHEKTSYIAALLNSKVIWWLTTQVSPSRQGGFYELKPMYVSQFPIPSATPTAEKFILQLTDGLLLLVSQPPTPQLALSIAFFERVLDALIYELYLPDELHSRGYQPYQIISAAPWPVLSGNIAKDLKALEEVFRAWYAPEHPIRQLTYYIDTVPAVQIIEGKTEAASGAGA